jgi:putative transposase
MMKNALREDNQNPEIQILKAAMKETKDRRMFERYQTILLHLHGVKCDQISIIVGRTTVTIGSYVKAYRTKGLDGLVLRESPGRPSFLTKEQEEQVRKLIVEQRPSDVGFPSEMNWTAPLLRDWIQHEFSVKYSERGTRKLLRLLGFSYTKPTYTLAHADPKKQEQFKLAFEEVKKIDSARN